MWLGVPVDGQRYDTFANPEERQKTLDALEKDGKVVGLEHEWLARPNGERFWGQRVGSAWRVCRRFRHILCGLKISLGQRATAAALQTGQRVCRAGVAA